MAKPVEKCSEEGCRHAAFFRGLCRTHYVQWRLDGRAPVRRLRKARQPPPAPVEEPAATPGTAVKLLTLWGGRLPGWLPLFKRRMAANRLVGWELIPVRSVSEVNALAERMTGTPCRKGSFYALCDLRPLLGEMYADRLRGYAWWGWCDLDIVTGDLDGMLGPMLDDYDIISTEFYCTNGAMMLLRNVPEVNALYRRGPYAEALLAPEYQNFDEGGKDSLYTLEDDLPPAGFARVVADSGLRVRWDRRSWHEGREMVGDRPSRVPELRGNCLVELPGEREILLYHFGSKIWPLQADGRPRLQPAGGK